ncbi:uncharacterized protein si:dkeyp-100a1.6 [Megalops cyprinoides]|uniref:uncharacterized protein si:dkeyp-100a1.6 n=1 Tax=Megalops cyprinoides TaxID=118141 RepID=UPI001864D4C3|nr:uncharacterized protein si:dkeyp-100a1.6 [Megalops cyprinoides]
MLAVLETWEEEGRRWQDHTLLYLSLIGFKVGLNALTLVLCSQSLRRSFMGLSGASLCLVDVLLLCGTAYIWLFRQHLNAASSLCLLLSHSSTVYSLLPLPFLLLGALDYCATLSPVSRPTSLHRTRSCCLVLLSIWALACVYSYHCTDSEVIIATDGEPMLLCTVQDSAVVLYFCAGTSLAIAAVLLYYSQRAPECFRTALRLSRQWDASPPVPHCDLPLSYRKAPQPAAAEQAEGLPDPPLLLRFTLGFSLYWIPFLGVNMACRLLNLATPSYVTVNLLWVLCANSVLIGTVLWFQSRQPGPCGNPPDDTCRWSVYKLQSGDESKLQEKLSQGIYTLSSRDTDKLLYV